MFIKLLFFIGWLGLGIMSLAGLLTSIIPKYALILDFNSWSFRGGLFAISIFYLLLVVEKFTSIFIKDDKGYEFTSEKGTIKVSAISVNNLIKEIVEENKNVKKVKVTSNHGKKGLKVNLSIEINTLPNLSKEYELIQETIISNLKEKLNIEVESININTSKLISSTNAVSTFKKTDNFNDNINKADKKENNNDDVYRGEKYDWFRKINIKYFS